MENKKDKIGTPFEAQLCVPLIRVTILSGRVFMLDD